MNTTTTTTFMGYTLQQGEARVSPYTIMGEYHFHGKRGAHYVTVRWFKKDGTPGDVFKFLNARTGVFVNIAGNYAFGCEVLEQAVGA